MYLKGILLVVVNLALVGLFIYLLRKPGGLSYCLSGSWWLTWLSVAVITLRDELTSVFYATAEPYRSVGGNSSIVMTLVLT